MTLTMDDCHVLAYRMETMDEEMLQASYSAVARARASVSNAEREELDGVLQQMAWLLLQRRSPSAVLSERRVKVRPISPAQHRLRQA